MTKCKLCNKKFDFQPNWFAPYIKSDKCEKCSQIQLMYINLLTLKIHNDIESDRYKEFKIEKNKIISLDFTVYTEDHGGYCSDYEDEDIRRETKNITVKLPLVAYLLSDDDINSDGQVDIHNTKLKYFYVPEAYACERYCRVRDKYELKRAVVEIGEYISDIEEKEQEEKEKLTIEKEKLTIEKEKLTIEKLDEMFKNLKLPEIKKIAEQYGLTNCSTFSKKILRKKMEQMIPYYYGINTT